MASTSSRIYVVEGAKISLEVLRAVASLVPGPLSNVIEEAQKVITLSETIKANRDDCMQLRNRVLQLLPVVVMEAKRQPVGEDKRAVIPLHLRDNIERFRQNLEAILQTMNKINSTVTSKSLKKKFKALMLSSPNTEAIKKCKDDLDWAVTAFEVSNRFSEAVRLCDLTTKVNTLLTSGLLSSLPRAYYASHSAVRSDQPSTCFEGTRTGIINMIFEWILDPNPTSDQIFFLNGIAGVGKTTIAHTVAQKARHAGLLGGDFFFSRQGEADLRDARKVFPTLAYQLAQFDPEFGQLIAEALEKEPQAPFEGLKRQLDHLIINPLSSIRPESKRTVVIIFDAFDECEPRGAKEILQLLLAAIPSLPFFLKIFLTGRPEDHILSVLSKPIKGLATTALHDIEPLIVKDDIRRYLRAKLAELPGELRVDLPDDWAKEYEIELLIEKSDGLFIYAVTAIRFLSDHHVLNPPLQFKILMEVFQSNGPGPTNAQPFRDLDALYMQLLRCALSPTNPDYVVQTLRAVLGTMVILRDPLPQPALEQMASLQPGEATATLRQLHSVILPSSALDNCPRIYHPSFPDFIQDSRRCTDERFCIDTGRHEARLALTCLNIINSTLHKAMISHSEDIDYNSDVENLDQKIASAYPPAVHYACRYWASHLEHAKGYSSDLIIALETFALRFLLLWLEAMSWLGEVTLALRSIETSKAWATNAACPSSTEQLLNDAHRLLLAHSRTVTQSAPHIVRSVLPFIPRETLLATTYFESNTRSLQVIDGVDATWSPCLIAITGSVQSMALSPDQARLAYGGEKGISILDLSTGGLVATFAIADWLGTSWVAFTADGAEVLSAHWNTNSSCYYAWDVVTGRKLETYHYGADVLCASPDGKRFASARKSSISVWKTGADARMTSESDMDQVLSMRFSPDSMSIAMGSSDCGVQIWDAEACTCTARLAGHSGRVNGVAFSTDGHHLLTGSQDQTIRVWDLRKNAATLVLEGYASSVWALDPSPDGQYVISGHQDGSLLQWNLETGGFIPVFQGSRMYGVISAVYCLGGACVASCSQDGAIRVWDAKDGTTGEHSRSNSNTPHRDPKPLALSHDGTRLASRFSSGMIVVTSATESVSLKQPPEYTNAACFSPNNIWVASNSKKPTIHIWDATLGAPLSVLRGHSQVVTSMAFSPCSTRIASASEDCTIRVWNIATAATTATVETESISFTAISFAPDGGRVVTGSDDGLVQIWEVETSASRITRPPTPQPSAQTMQIADGRAEGSKNTTNDDAHDVTRPRGRLERTFRKVHNHAVRQVAYSSNGNHIASASITFFAEAENGAWLWDANSGAGRQVLHDPGQELTSAKIEFCSDEDPATQGPDSLAIITLDRQGRLQCQQGKRRRMWMIELDLPRVDVQLCRYLGFGKMRCVIHSTTTDSVVVLDLQL